MEYSESFHPRFKSDLKKIDKRVVQQIYNVHLDTIVTSPEDFPPLKGKLSGLRSYHFRHDKTEYRIAYEILGDKHIVFYYMVSTRENFYKKLTKRV